ncbi:MAG: FAD-dependent oxidoreductase, partial [Lentisphaeria bacterium]|nr:FAD-dependent oxidoreductase [Lentisphaeria bacterium]
PMDDHDPAGMNGTGRPNTNYPAPSPYGIPYRSLYSRNVENLFFAGRNISVTHAALSSTRVMATCATVGQAVGVAAAIAAANGLTPRGVYEQRIQELQNTLMDDDCYLPWHVRPIAELSKNAILRASEGDPEVLRNGIDRPLDGHENVWSCQPNGWAEYDFGRMVSLKRARLIFDSDLNRKGQGDCATYEERNLLSNYPLNQPDRPVPPTLVKSFRLEVKDATGLWKTVWETTTNHQRLVMIPLDCDGCAVRIVPTETWGAPSCRLFAFEVGD